MKAGARHRASKRAEFEEAVERPLSDGAAFLASSERRNPHRGTSRAGTGIAVNSRDRLPGRARRVTPTGTEDSPRLRGPVVLVRDGTVPDRLERRSAQLDDGRLISQLGAHCRAVAAE